MPHVVVEGPIDLEAIRQGFAPQLHRVGEDVVKIGALYMERDGREGLFDALVVESGHRQHFFIQLRPREDGVTVRLLPQTDPEKTPGVKRALAAAARLIRDLAPEQCRFAATNIDEYLEG